MRTYYEIAAMTDSVYGERARLYYNDGKWRRLEDGDAEAFTLQSDAEIIAQRLFDEDRASIFPFASLDVTRWDYSDEDDKLTPAVILTIK